MREQNAGGYYIEVFLSEQSSLKKVAFFLFLFS